MDYVRRFSALAARLLPAVCLVALLFWTWHTMHAGTVNFQSKAPAAGVNA